MDEKFRLVSVVGFAMALGMRELEHHDLVRLDEMLGPPKNGTISQRQLDELLAAMKSGRKIEAIKCYRSLTGTGLRESKEAVEAFWLQQHYQPEYAEDNGPRY